MAAAGPLLSTTSSARGEPDRAFELRGHDGAHFRLGDTAACDHAPHLIRFRAVDDEDAVDDRQHAAALEQQRHDHDAVGASPGGDRTPAPSAEISGCSSRLEARACRRVGKHRAPQRGAIELAVGETKASPNAARIAANPGCARRREFVCQRVGVDDLDAKTGKGIGHLGLAAANAPGEAYDQRHDYNEWCMRAKLAGSVSRQVQREQRLAEEKRDQRPRSPDTDRTPAVSDDRGP